MKKNIKNLIKKLPWIGHQLEAAEKYYALHAEPGSYNSPIVTWKEVESNSYYNTESSDLKGIIINQNTIEEYFNKWLVETTNFPFPSQKSETYRYYYNNPMYGILDGTIYFGFLLNEKPNKIIEVGSGYSTALAIDTYENFINSAIHIQCIDPYTDRVHKLMTNNDLLKFEYIREPVQKLSTTFFNDLKSGDLLFIDSSHIVKTASDLNYLFFEILPILKPGVWIHIHDIFYPFEYPSEWIKSGLCFNEAYFLRSFLQFNTHFEICMWNNKIQNDYSIELKNKNAELIGTRGGSIYLRKK